MAAKLTVASRSTSQALVVRLAGVLGGVGADHAALREVVAALPPPPSVVFDVREVRLLRPAGLHEFLAVVEALERRGVPSKVVVGPLSAAGRSLRAGELPSGLEMFDDLAGALQVVGEASPIDPAEDAFAEQLASLTRVLVGASTVGVALHRIVDAARTIVPGADLVSVTLRDRGGAFFTPVETDALAGALDEVQYRTGQGPCLDAARPEGPGFAASDDLTVEDRWPRFAQEASIHGLAAVLSTDLHIPLNTALGGALNIYSERTAGLDHQDRHTALLLASHASLALAYASAVELSEVRERHLRRAIDTRDVIGQAKGILMGRRGMTADEAFEVLRRTSQDLNVKLVGLARTLTEHPDGLDTA
ncbi:ANTAR domain-containing protein [Actinophytocola sp. NPDC049390]|uniref:ANTAR domain-containing protein n=1 Tax=Actinophytocola sp. NPDC049390 TaxID=3363894 RepID=UPI0037AB22F9